MNRFKRTLQLLLAVIAATQITACSKTVQWEEEVPLNTGEVIWVKRTDTFVRRSEPGNPLQMGWWPDGRSYKFSWQGQAYSYDVKGASTGPILMHVYLEEKTVAMVDSGWPTCSGYGEFRWTSGGWQLQSSTNSALIGQPRNLMDYYSAEDGAIPARVTQEFIRNSRFDLPQKGGSLSHLLASKIATNCSGRK
jgi:hypothetical protein